MPEFIRLLQPKSALDILLNNTLCRLGSEIIPTADALGRITSSLIKSPQALPSFNRSAMDGYAVIAGNTYGANDSLPVYLQQKGEVFMGLEPSFAISENQCALIHTGGMLPEGADAVVMLENTQNIGNDIEVKEIEIYKPAAVGENVILMGEDVKLGEEIIKAGTRLRAVELGGLMALGLTNIQVFRKTRVGVISTGDEVTQPWLDIKNAQVRDVNTYTISSLVKQHNQEAISYGICPDNYDILLEKATLAHKECDIVVIVAGSSASIRDLTSSVINQLGKPGVLVHGINIRPGKPLIIAICDGKPVIGLPGNPLSAFVTASLFLNPLMDKISGLNDSHQQIIFKGKITINVSSKAGREDWIPIVIKNIADETLLEPVFFKSNLIFSLIKADGLMKIPSDSSGLPIGSEVEYIKI